MAALKTFLILIGVSVASGMGYDQFIQGGDPADIEDFPYIGSFTYYGKYDCAASLITYNTAVTAAHCLLGRNITKMRLRFGSAVWNHGGQEVNVKRMLIHKNFRKATYDNDVAVLILSENVTDENAIPIPLAPADRKYATGTVGVAAGWGRTSFYGALSEMLLKVDLPVFKRKKCQEVHRTITKRQICAGYKKGGMDTCRGDSGGPYVINGELAGIVSFGEDCGKPSVPGVYAFVPKLNDWIRKRAGM